MIPCRDIKGVRVRADGKGDGWARAHRELGLTFNMTDIDGLMGLVGFAANTGDKLFMEYVPDNYQNRLNLIRQYAVVAMFDRKASREYAFSDANRVSLSWHLDHCRKLAQTQPKAPKFFLVIGRDEPPWELIEMNIHTGEVVTEQTLNGMNWRVLWEQTGLVALRNELRGWIDPPNATEGRTDAGRTQ